LQAKIYEYFLEKNDTTLLLCKDDADALLAGDVLKMLGYDVHVLPDFRASYADDLRPYQEELITLLDSLQNYYKSKKHKKILLSPFRTLIHDLPIQKLFAEKKVAFGDTIALTEFKEMLLYWGYDFVEIVEEKGEVSFRGDIIDIYPRNSKSGYRISLFDDEIESIRPFSSQTQKSLGEELEEITIVPALFALDEEMYRDIQNQLESFQSDAFVKDMQSLGFWCLQKYKEDLCKVLKPLCSTDLREDIQEYFSFGEEKEKMDILLNIPAIPDAKKFKPVQAVNIKDFLAYHKDKKITIIANHEAIVKQHDLPIEDDIKYLYADYIINLISDDRLIISLNKPERKKRKKRATLVLDDLKSGDYVVHENYGIGIFKGLRNTKVLGIMRDFVEIAYQGDDTLLVPVENLNVIDRYISDGGNLAVLDRLGKTSFSKLKAKAKTKLFEIAKEIIEIAAQRELTQAPVIKIDFPSLTLFQNDAGFVYTQDQSKAIEQIFDDLKSGKVMDMLLSGDVGFGKTEVAMNAIFAAVKSGYQAAFIAPTTLLSTQHYKSLKERFSSYGISVEKINRFTTAKEKAMILRGLKDGSIDVCIGTHALFGVEFSNLALLILDEEHKFGVKQKEKLKNFKENLHVLSMSATPIPRSLNMALSSIKQYSQLLTPPLDREDIRTFVKEYEEKLIKEVVLREIRRGGQIFYIHNRIASIEDKKKQLQEILPNIKILVLHSKITPAVTEKEMMRFEAGEYNLLLSTSIVESGIHIPNVNTMLVENADNFGMADLHQLRGRVGRGKRQGYCYFLVKNKDTLSDQSKKRLIALESNSFLGSGSVLAYHDLEIRGGGNLIGEAQSGHIKNIGYSLYLKMLEDALNTLLNEKTVAKKEVEVKLSVSAFLNSDVIGEDRIRLELYRRLSRCESAKEVYEIEEEMCDRFGKLDNMTKQFLEIIVIKILASQKSIHRISSYATSITIEFDNDTKEYLTSPSKDDDDIIATTLKFLRK